MTEPTRVVAGDTLTLTITGKVADPTKANTPEGTTLKIFRPALGGLYAAQLNPACRIDLVLDADAEIDYNVQSRWKNGVHIDEAGRYWMRRPDGWHEMSIADNTVPNVLGSMFAPNGAQRLREDKE